MERIKINDGTKEYEIVNQNDKVLGVFRFNPADTNIIEKYNDVVEGLKEVVGKLGTGDDMEQVVREANKGISEKLDILFGEDTSKTFFSITGPLSPLANGQLFVENILEAIGAVIEKEIHVRLKKVREHMDSYTEKYNK